MNIKLKDKFKKIKKDKFTSLFYLLLGTILLLSLIELINFLTLNQLSTFGILPRSTSGLYGIFTSNFIHANWGHLFSNLLILIPLIAISYLDNPRNFIFTSITGSLIGGLIVWLFGSSTTSYVGSSILIFVLFSNILFHSILNKRFVLLVFASLIIYFQGSAFYNGIFNTPEHVSSLAHLGGFIGGLLSSLFFHLHSRKNRG